MDIKENFAAALKALRLKRHMSMREFSSEMGISLSSLAEYESGRRMPRGDTLELMAERLHIPPSALVSEASSADQSVTSCLDQLALAIENLHPHVKLSARYALRLLRTAFRNSEELFLLEARDTPPEDSDRRFRYRLYEPQCEPFAYGILAEERAGGDWATAASFAPFSGDRLAVLQIVLTANELQLPPQQFFSDVLPDLMPWG